MYAQKRNFPYNKPLNTVNMRILSVEDDQNIHQLILLSLREAGFETVGINNAEGAKVIVEKNPHFYDVILIDENLGHGKMTGTELAEYLREIQFPGHIIAFSSEWWAGDQSQTPPYFEKSFHKTDGLLGVIEFLRTLPVPE